MSICIREQYIELVLGKEYYAMNTKDIYKMIKVEADGDTPKHTHYMNERLYLHGKEVPVISLKQLFGMPEAAYTKAARIIVVRHSSGSVGFVVDQVNKVSTYDIIQTVPGKTGHVSGSYFSGIGLREGKQVSILNTDEILLRILTRTNAG